MEEVDTLAISNDGVLIKIRACGICVSDIAYYWSLSLLKTQVEKNL